MTILGIESSCDETAAAVFRSGRLLSNVVASQTVHETFGGVVPELASRAHHKTISRTVAQALEEAGMDRDSIDAIAVTEGPGLMGSLLVGLCFAKGLSLATGKPLIGVNHMDAHMYANFIENEPRYPFVCLTVSGGHTRLIHVTNPFEHNLLGKTRDDAAGEAFDKIGKLLGLGYPAGPEMDHRARSGDPEFVRFPRAMMDRGYDFSFSGLKTSVRYHVQEKGDVYVRRHLDDLCASVSAAVTDVLVAKLERAVRNTGVPVMLLAGGVAANSMLREKCESLAGETGIDLLVPGMEFCTDNAAMIAMTGYMKAERGEFDGPELKPYARIPDEVF